MKKAIAALILILGTSTAGAQQLALERLSSDLLAVTPPSLRVDGPPGEMRIRERSCHAVTSDNRRRRIVDIAVQEWGYFGFNVVDQTNVDEGPPQLNFQNRPRRRVWLNPVESARVADSIAGYWAITPDGSWILSRQNDVWNGFEGSGSRWRDPWSAAFISWVMCEAGFTESAQFQRAIAHHSYIDQAIVARDSGSEQAAFVAYDIGEQTIEPGDMLCAGRRPNYRRLNERRQQLGIGIRSHCDIVIKLDRPNDRIMVIGGNVRGSVSLKLHAAEFEPGSDSVQWVGRGRRNVFAHLKLRAEPIAADAFETTPTIRTIAVRDDAVTLLRQRLKDEAAFRFEATSAVQRAPTASGSAL
jgi:hypothetical protein